MVHGDDFLIVGRDKGREHVLRALRNAFELKEKTLGPGEQDLKEMKVLRRVMSCSLEGYSLEADASLVEAAVQRMGLEEAKGACTPGAAI